MASYTAAEGQGRYTDVHKNLDTELPPRLYETATERLVAIKDELAEAASGPQESVLREADRLINGPKRSEYGDVQESFVRVAEAWSKILDAEVTAPEVAKCMIALKMERLHNRWSRDTIVDIAGYAGLLAQLVGTDG